MSYHRRAGFLSELEIRPNVSRTSSIVSEGSWNREGIVWMMTSARLGSKFSLQSSEIVCRFGIWRSRKVRKNRDMWWLAYWQLKYSVFSSLSSSLTTENEKLFTLSTSSMSWDSTHFRSECLRELQNGVNIFGSNLALFMNFLALVWLDELNLGKFFIFLPTIRAKMWSTLKTNFVSMQRWVRLVYDGPRFSKNGMQYSPSVKSVMVKFVRLLNPWKDVAKAAPISLLIGCLSWRWGMTEMGNVWLWFQSGQYFHLWLWHLLECLVSNLQNTGPIHS